MPLQLFQSWGHNDTCQNNLFIRTWDFITYLVGDKLRLRWACAYAVLLEPSLLAYALSVAVDEISEEEKFETNSFNLLNSYSCIACVDVSVNNFSDMSGGRGIDYNRGPVVHGPKILEKMPIPLMLNFELCQCEPISQNCSFVSLWMFSCLPRLNQYLAENKMSCS